MNSPLNQIMNKLDEIDKMQFYSVYEKEIKSLTSALRTACKALEEHYNYAEECRMDWSEYDGRTHLKVASSINSETLNQIAEKLKG